MFAACHTTQLERGQSTHTALHCTADLLASGRNFWILAILNLWILPVLNFAVPQTIKDRNNNSVSSHHKPKMTVFCTAGSPLGTCPANAFGVDCHTRSDRNLAQW